MDNSLKSKDVATELLVAADRCGCILLTLVAESLIVEKFLTAENAAESLTFADSHSCPLLKEAAIKLFINDFGSFFKAEPWSRIKEPDGLDDRKEILRGRANGRSG
jgi:hypothetical protein